LLLPIFLKWLLFAFWENSKVAKLTIRIISILLFVCIFDGNICEQWVLFNTNAEASSIRVHGIVTDSTNVRLPHSSVMFIAGSDTTRAFTDSTGYYELILDTLLGVQTENIPSIITLAQNYPNPFNPSTLIQYTLNEYLPVKLDIYSVHGQKILSLVNDYRSSGVHSVVWNGRDKNGYNVAAGVYLYQLKAGSHVVTKKMLLLDGTSGHSSTSLTAKAHSVGKRTNIPAEKEYIVIAEKSTMESFRDRIIVSFDQLELEKDIVLLDEYHPYGLYFDSHNYNNEFIYPGESLGLTLVGIHEEYLPATCQVTLTSGAGDKEMIILAGSSEYIRQFGNCAWEGSLLFYRDSRRGTIVSSNMAPVQGNGIIEVNAHSDTVKASISFFGGNSIKASLLVIDSVDYTIQWSRKYIYWGNEWFLADEAGKWELVEKTGVRVIFVHSVTENEISDFILNNEFRKVYKFNEYIYYFTLNDSNNSIQFLKNNQDSNLLYDASANTVICVAKSP
jgi:hypothetical protein